MERSFFGGGGRHRTTGSKLWLAPGWGSSKRGGEVRKTYFFPVRPVGIPVSVSRGLQLYPDGRTRAVDAESTGPGAGQRRTSWW